MDRLEVLNQWAFKNFLFGEKKKNTTKFHPEIGKEYNLHL